MRVLRTICATTPLTASRRSSRADVSEPPFGNHHARLAKREDLEQIVSPPESFGRDARDLGGSVRSEKQVVAEVVSRTFVCIDKPWRIIENKEAKIRVGPE